MIFNFALNTKAEGFTGSNVTAKGSYKFAGGDVELRGGTFKTVLKTETELRACRDVNHNFQPQRPHLKCSSGFSLEAELPQRGHFIVHICVKGPSGVTLKIRNVVSIVASFNRRFIGIRCYSVCKHFRLHGA